MNHEMIEYAEKQPTLTICNGGRQALVLLNETEEERTVTTTNAKGKEVESKVKVYLYDAVWLALNGKEPLEAAKASVLESITAHDLSEEVNHFTLNGKTYWLDKATRVGLMNSTSIAKNLGEEKVCVWLGDTMLSLAPDTVIALLSQIEMYAQDVYNITAHHRAAVDAMTDATEVLAYDYTANYPKPLTLTAE